MSCGSARRIRLLESMPRKSDSDLWILLAKHYRGKFSIIARVAVLKTVR